jgi:hypothetical protein
MTKANPDNYDLFNENVIERCIDGCIKKCINREFDNEDDVIVWATINTQFVYAMIQAEDNELNYEFELVSTQESGSTGFKFPNNYIIETGTFKILSNGEFVNEDLDKWSINQAKSTDGSVQRVYTYVAKNTLNEYIPIAVSQRYKLKLKRII